MLHKNALVKEINCKPSISVIISCRRQNIQQQILQNLYVYSPRHIITFVSFLDMTFIDFNFNLEIRVWEDGIELGNNKICLGDIELIGSKAANLTCLQAVFGDWVSINKSAPSNSYHSLVFDEVHVFDGKYIRADGSPGPISLRLMTSQSKDIVTPTQKYKTVKCIFCGVWVQNFVWNLKGALWNFTQNFEPILRKICILRCGKNLTTYGILELWHLKS